MTYLLTVHARIGPARVLGSWRVTGETPSVGDLVTVHPDYEPSGRSLTAKVTGVQRVIKEIRLGESVETHLSVTAFAE